MLRNAITGAAPAHPPSSCSCSCSFKYYIQSVQCDARSFFLCKWALAGGGGRSLYTTYWWPPGRSIFTLLCSSTSQLLGGHSLLYYIVEFLEVILYHATAIPTNVHLEGHSKQSKNAILPSLFTVYFGSSVNIISLLLYRFTTLGEGHSVLPSVLSTLGEAGGHPVLYTSQCNGGWGSPRLREVRLLCRQLPYYK